MHKIEPNETETKSVDIVAEKIGQLKQLFPETVSEGNVDFEILRQILGGSIDERDEKFGLNWHGKRQARQAALRPSTGTLRPRFDDSVDWNDTQNMVIEGDNLEVLKLLQKAFHASVKLIYIDPPYNTGNDFIYPDDFTENLLTYLQYTGQADAHGRKFSTNTEANGRFHSKWLSMMYPRLFLSRSLLRDDGVIMISIDDSEVSNLRKIGDEIFGEENFVACLIWEKGRKNDAKLVSVGHEYIVIYVKNKARLTEKKVKWREAKPGAEEIQAEYLRLRALHGANNSSIERDLKAFYESLPKTHPSKKHSRYGKVDDYGVWRDDNMSWPGGGGPDYDVIHPVTQQKCAVPEGGWRYSTPEKMQAMIDQGRVVFRTDHTEPPIRKTYLVRLDDELDDEAADDIESEQEESDDLAIQVAGSYFYRSALQASNELSKLFGKKIFNNPKDREVLARWMTYVGCNGPNDIILDFFAGSGTTGHAVLAQNVADNGSRRYILVQLPEPLDKANKDQKVAATFLEQQKRPLTIAEITKERLRRAAGKLKQENPNYKGDLGFRVFKLDSSNIRTWESESDDLAQSIFNAVEHIKSDRTEQDILFELLLKLGLDLSVAMETKTIAGKEIHSIGAGTLMVCLTTQIAATDVEKLALGIVAWSKELAPIGDVTCIFRDSAFADDVAKANLTAILQQHGLEQIRSL